MAIDDLDARIIALFSAEPRVGVLECSRRLGVARGTVQARLDRLQARGVIRGFGPDVDPAALGYDVTAFATLEIRQGEGRDALARRLASIPEVLEVHTITGQGDMLCRIVARSNADLQAVIDQVVNVEGIVRTSTVISLATPVPYRVLPLVRAVGGGGPSGTRTAAGCAKSRPDPAAADATGVRGGGGQARKGGQAPT